MAHKNRFNSNKIRNLDTFFAENLMSATTTQLIDLVIEGDLRLYEHSEMFLRMYTVIYPNTPSYYYMSEALLK
ncbi:unnamed protein product [Acanthoscelides obtectus]|uniref:Uncharacterized protein n=1 Tax=Acanthoscelides obtectus TaxID=200917 RepID=A0A9P0K0A3_ACAOB|nr:unnamed protein product [Acanthoscelides obtectus]CAK1648606.1 hypothetical protein AOBTE_LOCUS15780 [Acanthoscelides obtectus]